MHDRWWCHPAHFLLSFSFPFKPTVWFFNLCFQIWIWIFFFQESNSFCCYAWWSLAVGKNDFVLHFFPYCHLCFLLFFLPSVTHMAVCKFKIIFWQFVFPFESLETSLLDLHFLLFISPSLTKSFQRPSVSFLSSAHHLRVNHFFAHCFNTFTMSIPSPPSPSSPSYPFYTQIFHPSPNKLYDSSYESDDDDHDEDYDEDLPLIHFKNPSFLPSASAPTSSPASPPSTPPRPYSSLPDPNRPLSPIHSCKFSSTRNASSTPPRPFLPLQQIKMEPKSSSLSTSSSSTSFSSSSSSSLPSSKNYDHHFVTSHFRNGNFVNSHFRSSSSKKKKKKNASNKILSSKKSKKSKSQPKIRTAEFKLAQSLQTNENLAYLKILKLPPKKAKQSKLQTFFFSYGKQS